MQLENEPKPRLYLGKPRTYQTVGCWEFEKRDANKLLSLPYFSSQGRVTEVYTDPANVALRDGAQYDHIAKAMDSIYGTAKSLVPVAKAASPPDALQKAAEVAEFLGPAHAKIHSLAIDHQRAHSGMSYQQAYSHLYSRPENEALRNSVKAEHMRSTMARANG